jgi:signal peptidase
MIPNAIRLARRTVGFIGLALVVLLVGFSLFTHLAPLTGRQLFIVGGGSMEPSIPLGSLVIVTRTDAMTVGVGDVLTIRADNGVVFTHRVTRIVDLAEGRFFETKGDANQAPDGSLVPARAIIGAADVSIPFAGYAQGILSKIPGMIAALFLLATLLLLYLLLEMLEPTALPVSAQARDPVWQ